MYAKPIRQLIQAFTKLPSVGPRTAERFVFHLLRSGKKDVAEITLALKTLIDEVKSCQTCWDFSDQSPCAICADTNRDQSLLCIVAHPQDVQAMEGTGTYQGRYHLLRGTLNTTDDRGNAFLKIQELLARLRSDNAIREVILALNPDLPGETTMLYLQQEIKKVAPELTVSRLARGLPLGADLQYADEVTLQNALRNRTRN